VEGRDAASFLHALVSNDVAALVRGRGCYAVYLTPQGRIIADLRIYHRGDHLLLDVAPGSAAALIARLDTLIFAEDVRLCDESARLGQIRVIGDAAADVIATSLGVEPARIAALGRYSQEDVSGGFVARTDDAVAPSFDVFIDAARAGRVAGALVAAGAVALDPAIVDALRIDAGRPLFGVDMTDETIPLEAGLLDRAICQTKGCYVGQEVIVRVLHRGGGRVARRLVKLVFDAGMTEAPVAGAPLTVEGRDVGRVTSAAMMPASGRAIALGYVRREDAEIGRRVEERGIGADIVGLAG
jgi:folate-binding protein YgfZ